MHTKNITPGTSFFMISVTNPHFMLFFARPLLEIGHCRLFMCVDKNGHILSKLNLGKVKSPMK